MKKKVLSYFLSCAVLLSSYVHPLEAAPNFKSGAFLRDAEIESILTDFISPIFIVAGLNPRDIHIYIINNPDLNAAAGPNYSFFLNSGFLIDASNADEIVGVLAHE
ncbi:MAG: M48 family metalloprotease, partial [Candidatus Nucleicultricaceae bacterium]